MGRKAGADALHKSLQIRLAIYPANVVVRIDKHETFQNIKRSKACAAVAEHAPCLLEPCRTWYDGSSVHVIQSHAGPRQNSLLIMVMVS